MKKICLTAMAVVTYACTYAQNMHYYIGTGTPKHEVAKVVKTLPDGSSIVAGYIYNNATDGSTFFNADNLCFRIDANGTIMWASQWGTTGGNDNDIIHDMIITSNGNEIVCAGTAGNGSVYGNNTAALYKLDINTGAVLNQYFMRAAPSTAAGDIYYGVCETANGDFVAVGGTNFFPRQVDALVSLVDGSTFTGIYDITMPFIGHSDAFTAITADGNTVYMTGYRAEVGITTLSDQIVVGFDPYSQTLLWQESYDFNYTVTDNTGAQNNITSNYPHTIRHDNGKLLIGGALMNDFGTSASLADRQYIFTCDMLNGANPEVRIVSNYQPFPNAFPFSNHSSMLMVNFDEVYVSNVPGSNKYIYASTLPMPAVAHNAWISHITNLSNPLPPVVASGEIRVNNSESIQSMEFILGHPTLNGFIAAAGNVQPNMSNNYDVYFAHIDPAILTGNDPCMQSAITGAITTPVSQVPLNTGPTNLTNLPNLSVVIFPVALHVTPGCQTGGKQSLSAGKVSAIEGSFKLAPNPSSGQFNIHYAIPATFGKASIGITDMLGKTIHTQSLIQSSGIVNVQLPAGTPAGTYMCELYADGEITATQKLVVK